MLVLLCLFVGEIAEFKKVCLCCYRIWCHNSVDFPADPIRFTSSVGNCKFAQWQERVLTRNKTRHVAANWDCRRRKRGEKDLKPADRSVNSVRMSPNNLRPIRIDGHVFSVCSHCLFIRWGTQLGRGQPFVRLSSAHLGLHLLPIVSVLVLLWLFVQTAVHVYVVCFAFVLFVKM